MNGPYFRLKCTIVWVLFHKQLEDALNFAPDTYYFTALGHWELSHVVTTNHLLSVIAITNTLGEEFT